MLTRHKASILKREVDDIPLPKTSRRPRKTAKCEATVGERIINGLNPDEYLESRAQINPVQESADKRIINTADQINIIEPSDNDNIPLTPLNEINAKPWARWQTFLRNGLITIDSHGEPTNAQYEKAWTIWNYILQRTNVATKVSGPVSGFTRANGPAITLLIRDHRGGEPNSEIINSITDPDLVHIQAYKCRFGFLERDVIQYFQEKTVEEALERLRNIGWNDTPEEEKRHELYQCFY